MLRLRKVHTLEMSFAFVPMDAACFKEWARLMLGKPDALRSDAMIAATRNEKDFKQLGMEILNPFKPV